MNNRPCLLTLTCTINEADKITKVLLDQKLVACVKQIPITVDFLWHGQVEHDDEALLLMESIEQNFEKIEDQINSIHSYDTFVLNCIPISKMSKKAKQWLEKELSDG